MSELTERAAFAELMEALAQYIAMSMNAAEKAGVNKIEVLDRVFEVISYHHNILFHRQGEP
jgi:hypothetical protein